MAFWNREYPAIRSTSALLEAVEGCGYTIVSHFPLPRLGVVGTTTIGRCRDNINAFRERHRNAPDAQELAGQCQHEIDIWHAHSEFYGYEFLVLQAR